MTFFPHEQPFTLPNTFCPSENVNPCRETPLSATTQWNCEVWTPSDTGKKKTVKTNRKESVGVQSQLRIHSDSITEGQYGDEQGPWIDVENDEKRWKLKAWEEASMPLYVSSSVTLGLLCGDFRAFLFHTAFLVNGEYTLLTSWRLVRLPLIPQQPFCTGPWFHRVPKLWLRRRFKKNSGGFWCTHMFWGWKTALYVNLKNSAWESGIPMI